MRTNVYWCSISRNYQSWENYFIKVTRYCYLKSNESLLFVDAEIRLASFMKEKERDLQSVYLYIYIFLMTSLS